MPSGAYYPGLYLCPVGIRACVFPESLRMYVCRTVCNCLSYYSLFILFLSIRITCLHIRGYAVISNHRLNFMLFIMPPLLV